MKLIDLTAKKYNKLLVLCRVSKRYYGVKGHKETKWMCLCDCGRVVIKEGRDVRGRVKSCGCAVVEASQRRIVRDQSARGKALAKVLENCIRRCYNKKDKAYRNYGERGITVAKEWRTDTRKFVKWALENGWSAERQIDRIDNNKGYYPENCRFVSNYENNHNKRRLMATNKTGYAGVRETETGFQAFIKSILINGGKQVCLGTFASVSGAVTSRNDFIRLNKLPHKIQEIK